MKAIILAAGRGSRMGAMTEQQPKCFTVLHGKTLLSWQIDALTKAGIKDFAIVCGYMKESFKVDVHYFENSRWQHSNMVSSLLTARSWLNEEPCIVSYSDIVYTPDVVKALMQEPADIAISYDSNWQKLWSLRFEDPLIDAESFLLEAEDYISDIGRKPKSINDVHGQYMGLLKFTPPGWKQVESFLNQRAPEAVDKLDMTSLLQQLIETGVKIKAVKNVRPWYEVDSINDLRCYEKLDRLF